MSIELPEIKILAKQMNEELGGKKIIKCTMQNYEKFQKIKCIDPNIEDYQLLVGGTIEEISSIGLSLTMHLSNGFKLLLCPEYGGEFFYQVNNDLSERAQMHLYFSDETALSCRLKGYGIIQLIKNNNFDNSYIYQRETSINLEPVSKEFTLKLFSELINKKRQLKSLMVGKQAIFTGISNSAYQDIIYQAKLHPKRKGADLDEEEVSKLYNAVVNLVNNRLKFGGKTKFKDLYGQSGQYIPMMGPNMKGKNCIDCGSQIEKIAHGGGHVYLCQTCQV